MQAANAVNEQKRMKNVTSLKSFFCDLRTPKFHSIMKFYFS